MSHRQFDRPATSDWTVERAMRLELTTLCLGSRCSTTELRPPDQWSARSLKPSMGVAAWHRSCGAEGIRTPDLLNAIQALSQLSYSPRYAIVEGALDAAASPFGMGRPVGFEPTTF